MKLAIDCRALRTTPTGIPNFLVSAINGISQHNPSWQLYLLANDLFNEELREKLIIRQNIQIIITPLKVLPNLAIFWYFVKVGSILKKIKPDVFWAPAFLIPPFIPAHIKTLVTVHDTVYKEHKETMSLANRLYFKLLHDQSINKADMLWFNSLYTQSRINQYFPYRKCKKEYVGFFIDNEIFKPVQVTPEEKQSIFQKYNLRDKFLLFVGSLEPRKNLQFLLTLMPKLATKGYKLLVVGAKGWGKTDIKKIVESEGFPREEVIFAGFISTEELVKIFNLASIYVSTSKNEGFGMPQLEAMACGCPVVSPHNSAMMEVVAGAGETVQGWNEQDWIDTIDKVYENRVKYIQAGFKRVEEYKREFVIGKLTEYIKGNLSTS
ncbi:MAG: glycosyltransferase family 4 protein [Bacteroidota bacterium]|nr:glycosyltransferase family 4 protein [Bacteroidota bacterium]